MFLFVVPITCFIIYLLEKKNKIANKRAKLLLIPISLLTLTYFIYNNTFFNFLNLFIIPLLVIFMILKLFDENIKKFNGISKLIVLFFAPLEFLDETWNKLIETLREKLNLKKIKEKKYSIKRILKAVFITMLVAIVIIILLSSADATFENIFVNLFKFIERIISKIQISEIMLKLILIAIGFAYISCFFNYISNIYVRQQKEENHSSGTKDNYTIKMVLGVLNVIYLVFCYIQVKNLFSGNMSKAYSYYAREGFFQLMIVSLINLVTILIAKRKEENSGKYIKTMSIAMIVFTFIILISATIRMYIYESSYGYTLLRLLVYCSLFTEALLLVPTILYILDKKVNLSKAYFIIILSVYVCMNFANFDSIIARRNIDRYMLIGKIDLIYLEDNTGTDGAKEFIRILDSRVTDEFIRLEVKNYLKNMYNDLKAEEMDFRNINISKMHAKSLIEEKIDNIEETDDMYLNYKN